MKLGNANPVSAETWKVICREAGIRCRATQHEVAGAWVWAPLTASEPNRAPFLARPGGRGNRLTRRLEFIGGDVQAGLTTYADDLAAKL
jgi:hypothetical protein